MSVDSHLSSGAVPIAVAQRQFERDRRLVYLVHFAVKLFGIAHRLTIDLRNDRVLEPGDLRWAICLDVADVDALWKHIAIKRVALKQHAGVVNTQTMNKWP